VELEGTYQRLLYSDDVNLLGKKVNAMTNREDGRLQSGVCKQRENKI
jgi:hypothetical protein